MKKQYLSASQFNRLFSPVSTADIPLNQQNLLFWMATDSTPRTPTNLAKEMHVTKAAITKASGPLLERGLARQATRSRRLPQFQTRTK